MHRTEGDLQPTSGPTSDVRALPARFSMPAIPRSLRVGATIVSYAMAFVAVGVLLAVTLPPFAGFHTITIYGGSMGDALPAGSVAVTRPVDDSELAVGDVIALGNNEDGLPTLHRIVTIEDVEGGRRVTTRGDANATNDPLPITVSGQGDRLMYYIPLIGYLLAFSQKGLGVVFLVGVPVGVWAIREAIAVARAIKRRRRPPPMPTLTG